MKTKTMEVKNNKLYMAGHLLEDLAEKYQTPLYVYDEEGILEMIKRYKNSFASKDFNCQVVYASKAFIAPYLCSILRREGLYIDAISEGDLFLLKKALYPMDHVLLHGNNKSKVELEMAIDSGVGTIVVDNLHELKLLNELSLKYKRKINTLFRLNPGIEGHTHAFVETSLLDSKFGESLYANELMDEIYTIYKESKYLVLRGFHSHIGSSITSKDVYLALAKKVVAYMSKVYEKYHFSFDTINFGGGFGVKYVDDDKEIDLEDVLPSLINITKEELKKTNMQIKNLMIEPGRSIVAGSGITIYTCGGVKKTYAGREYLFVDGGMPDNIRTALYDAKYTISNASNVESDDKYLYTISGKCCESGDIICRDVLLPKAKIGDIICTYCTGAYCYTMSMNYNNLKKPGVIFVKKDKITEVVRRQTNEELVNNFQFIDDIKIFDTHSDMLYDLDRKKQRGVENQFENYHVPQLSNSLVSGAIWTMYSPDDFNLVEGLKNALSQIDMTKLPNFKVILGLEGLRNLEKVEDIDKLYEMGFRHAMVTWNEENKYATGAKANKEHGLTEDGKRLYKRMQELDMIIDLAHLNEKSFYEALEIVDKNIIYSHGLCKHFCSHVRNLTDDQMRALKKKDGLFGLTLANNFVNDDKDKQDLSHFLDHVDYAKEIMGIDNLCFGFDFMDYLSEFPNSNIEEVSDATKAYRIIDGLRDRGYTEEEIKKICYNNFYNRFKDKIMFNK